MERCNVIDPLLNAGAKTVEEEGSNSDWEITARDVKKAIRNRILESYRNGQAAGPRYSGRPGRPEYQPRGEHWPVRV